MIEKRVMDYLAEKLDVPVYMEMPEKQPESFVLVEKTSSSRTNWIDSATIALDSYAGSMADAAALSEAVKAQMDKMAEQPDVSRSELNSDYNYTDTALKQYRYQAVYDLVYFE